MGRAEDKRQAARDAGIHHGLKAAAPHYLDAAAALVEARRPDEAVDLLGELLVAQERKRSLFGKVEKNPLGPARAGVALKFAEYSRLSAPSEDVLELLGELALEFPDEPVVRRANADALYGAGYIADATEEYRYCLRLNPDDGQILTRLTDAYAEMGRADHAIEFLRRGMRVHAEAQDYGQAMHLAIRWLGMVPGAAEEVLLLLKDWPADALRRQLGGVNQLAMLAKKDDQHDATWHKMVQAEFAAMGATGKVEPAAPVAAAPVAPPAYPTVKPTPAAPPKPVAPVLQKPIAPATPIVPPQPTRATTPPPPPARPTVLPTPARPTAAPPPAAKPAAAAQQTSAPATGARDAAPVRPTPPPLVPPSRPVTPPARPTPSQPMPNLEKVLQEAEQRASAPPARPQPPVAAAPPAQPAPPRDAAPPATPEPPAAPARTAAGGTAAGIKNFARRKAKELFDAGDYENAVMSLERVVRFGPDAEALGMLLTCYTQLKKPEDAKRVGMDLANLEVEAGHVDAAVSALTALAKAVPDPDVIKRRSELLAMGSKPVAK